MPSQSSVMVLLGLVASIQAVPAARPDPDAPVARQITLDPPTYTVTWETPLPPAPTDTETPGESSPPTLPSDSITLGPPTASITWDGPHPPTTTKKPGWPFFPWPTKKTTSSKISATVSWGKRQFEYDPEPTDVPEEPETHEDDGDDDGGDGGIIIIPTGLPLPNPPDSITIGHPSATISWGRRQFQTDFPDDPEEPEEPEEPEDPDDGGPIVISPEPQPNPPDTITLAPPTATITWGKRQFQTDFPDNPEEPEDPQEPEDPDDGGPIVISPEPQPNPPDTITLAPPTATIIWGKRQTNDFTLAPAKPSMTWGKRQDEDPEDPDDGGPIVISPEPQPNPPDTATLAPPTATITWGKRQTNSFTLAPAKPSMTWGKRQDEDPEDPIPEPTEITNPLPPAQTDDITLSPPEASITWGKREDAAAADWPPPTWSVIWPFPGRPTASISWGKRAPEPTEAAIFTCGTTNTVTTRVPCTTYSCGRECSLVPGSTTVRPPIIDITGIPECPLTATASNVCERCACPTTLIPHPSPPTITPKPPSPPPKPTTTCKTLTSTIVPPCIPPICPHADHIACRIVASEDVKREAVAEGNRMVEKRVVSLTTITVPAPKPTKMESSKCPTPLLTKTIFAGCPIYTCVPHGECGVGGVRKV